MASSPQALGATQGPRGRVDDFRVTAQTSLPPRTPVPLSPLLTGGSWGQGLQTTPARSQSNGWVCELNALRPGSSSTNANAVVFPMGVSSDPRDTARTHSLQPAPGLPAAEADMRLREHLCGWSNCSCDIAALDAVGSLATGAVMCPAMCYKGTLAEWVGVLLGPGQERGRHVGDTGPWLPLGRHHEASAGSRRLCLLGCGSAWLPLKTVISHGQGQSAQQPESAPALNRPRCIRSTVGLTLDSSRESAAWT